MVVRRTTELDLIQLIALRDLIARVNRRRQLRRQRVDARLDSSDQRGDAARLGGARGGRRTAGGRDDVAVPVVRLQIPHDIAVRVVQLHRVHLVRDSRH